MPLDPNEAPDGYVAVAKIDCDGCAFVPRASVMCNERTSYCSEYERADKTSVIFVKRPEAQAAPAAVAEPSDPADLLSAWDAYAGNDHDAVHPMFAAGFKAAQQAAAPAAAQPVASEPEFDGYKGAKQVQWYINELQRVRFLNQWLADAYSNELHRVYESKFRGDGASEREAESKARDRVADIWRARKNDFSRYLQQGFKESDNPEFSMQHDAVSQRMLDAIIATPPALVGLSDEQIMHLWFAAEPTPDGRPASWNYARAIERALAAANGATLREPKA